MLHGIDEKLRAKAVHTGNPVRPAVIEAARIAFPAFTDGRLRLLVTGGSQGARIFSDVVPAALELLSPDLRARINLVQQVRGEDEARVRDVYARLQVVADVAPFFADLPARMAGAHLVVARAGASTVSELAVVGRPAILVPFPFALDQDQAANAAHLAAVGAAEVVRQADFSPQWLAHRLTELTADMAILKGRAASRAQRRGPRRRRAARRSGDANGRTFRARALVATFSGAIFMKLPRELGPIHFVGIGGIGMSGIAEVLINLGYRVQGSDAAESANVKRLRDKGARVFIGHDAGHLGEAEVVVVSTAIKRDNPELAAAREKRLPVVRRAEMLAELMRLKQCVAIAGTHGKTTTTSLVATLLEAGGFDPTVINGGIINAYGTNARLGAGDWMVVEADESDGTFLKLPADVAIITNIDPEHLDHFKTFDAIKEAFLAFVENLPFYGFAVMCLDHPTVQELVGRIEDRRVLTYGENPQADVRLLDVDLAGGISRFNVLIRDRKTSAATYIDELVMPMPGHHNALNATAAIAVATELGVDGGNDPQGARRVRRRQAALHAHRRVERCDDLRRLRTSSGGDRRGAARRARCDEKPGHRRRAAASLYAPQPRSSTNSPPVSTMPMSSSSPMSMRPAKSRSQAPRATISWRR